MKVRVLFLIHDLGGGGAERVLVNLVNHLDYSKFEVTVKSLFDYGINREYLNENVIYKSCFKRMIRGNSKLMKLLTPKQLHRWLIKDKYDVEVAYLEGPSARIISGCTDSETKLVSWIHIGMKSRRHYASSFRSLKEANQCYNRFDEIICVSEDVKRKFNNVSNINVPISVIYNTNDTEMIINKAKEDIPADLFRKDQINIIGIGKLLKNKGFDRLARITRKLVIDGFNVHTYVLGDGPEYDNLANYIEVNHLDDNFTLLGFQSNPYMFLKNSDLFVCASFSEGFSTAATEALILGVPVCTVDVSGMKEMLGSNNEYGIVVENNEEDLYVGLKELLSNPNKLQYYKHKAKERGNSFNTKQTVKAVEDMLSQLKLTKKNT